ncbi:MAG: methyltransferase domain-containing protein [Acidimicrobiales bacterium]
MTEARYTHGHHESVLRSHRWRTAENSAAYLLDRLVPGMNLLDVGCGPGTLTCDLATRVAPGAVTGIDASAEVVELARAAATERGLGNVTFEVGDVFDLGFAEASFDVVHAHQVLQHLADPIVALREMRRVCEPGGTVAVRDSDYPTFTFYPGDVDLDRAIAAYGALTRVNGANWDAGRLLLHWANEVGFAEVVPSASVWCFATPAEREWWGGLWADRFTQSSLAEQLEGAGLASRENLESFAGGWRRWAASSDGWFAVVLGEVLCTR